MHLQDNLSRFTKDHLANIVNAVDFGVVELEDADYVIRLLSDKLVRPNAGQQTFHVPMW